VISFDELNFAGGRRLPMVHAAEGAECGLACLVMVGKYHGHDVDLNGLRQRYSMSLAGATLRNIMELASRMDLAARPLKVELEALKAIRTPAILHWNLNHFVVLKSIKGGRVTIHDPAIGARSLSLAELSDHYTGVALELQPAKGFSKIKAVEPVKITSLWSDSHGLWRSIFQVLALSATLQVVAFVGPFQTQLVIDEAIGRGDLDLLKVLSIGFAVVFVIQAVVGALRSWTLQVLGALFSFQVVGNLVRHLLRLPPHFFEKRTVGDILSRLGSSAAIRDVMTQGVVAAIVDGVMGLVAGVVLFIYSPLLALIVVVALLLSLVVALAYYPVTRRRSLEQLNASAIEQTYLMETVRAAATIKVMGRGSVRESGWRNLYANVTNVGLQTAKYNIYVSLLQGAIMAMQSILVLYFGARMVLQGDGMSIGMLMAFMSYRQTFGDRVLALINQLVRFRMLSLHLERLGDIVTAPAETIEDAPAEITVRGALSVRGMSFRYGEPDPLILDKIDLEIPAGDFLAITGPSGGGKSTLLKLMLGMQEPTKGEILIDGKPASPGLFNSWREQVGVVMQNDQLMSGTLSDNIAFFDPDLNMDRVHEAARAAEIHNDILRMPMQYLSLIGDMGSSLSAGQRQRVLLARALYRRPKILFLDEGTANLDEATEAAIGDLIQSLPITRIVVAHRPALIQRARRVAVVVGGRLVLREEAATPEGVL
jgi:ATP-binding cassette subfamily B protein RaxB